MLWKHRVGVVLEARGTDVCKYRVTGTEWRESNGDSTLDTNGDYQVRSSGVMEMSWRTGIDSLIVPSQSLSDIPFQLIICA